MMASSDSSSYRVVNLSGWIGGLRDQRTNPLFFPENCIADGENVDITNVGLRTRRGLKAVYEGFSSWSEIKVLQQIRFPTNETSYLVAQVAQPEISWFTRAGYPHMGHTAVVDESSGYIYVWGGGLSRNANSRALNGVEFSLTRAVHIYDTATDYWWLGAFNDDATMRCGAAGILVNGKIYFWGGGNWVYSQTWARVPCYELNIYDISNDTWTQGTAADPYVNAGRDYPCVVHEAGKLYFFCGTKDGIDVYDIAADEWSYINSGDDIYVSWAVGRLADGVITMAPGYYNDLEGVVQYNIGIDQWSFTETANLPTIPNRPGRFGEDAFTGITVGNTVYFWSELVDSGTDYQDPVMESWTFGASQNTVLAATPHDTDTVPGYGVTIQDMRGWGTSLYSVAYLNGKLYYFGGFLAYSYWGAGIVTNDTYVYDIATDAWELRSGPFIYEEDPTTAAFNKLFACSDNLPVSPYWDADDYGMPVLSGGLTFEEIYDLGAGAGPVSIAVLNDRAVITEGIANPPLVWGGAMAADGSDWMYPKTVLVSQDGVNFYDVSSWVCDRDPDTVADIGGINAWGFVAICCDIPKVSGFFIEMNTPNAGTGISTVTESVKLDDVAKVNRQDLKGAIVTWIADEEVLRTLSGAAVNLGGSPNKVKIPCADHSFFEGDEIEITGTANYNGSFTLGDQTNGDANNFVIEHAYTAETLASPDEAHVSVATGGGHFEGAQRVLVGDAVDMEGTPNKVKIPCEDHGFVAGDKITVRDTTNYDGVYVLPAQTGGDDDNFIIESAFNSETFASPDEARKRIVLAPTVLYADHLPTMTSNTAPSPAVASASTAAATAFRPFDGSSVSWDTGVFETAWVELDLGSGNGFMASAWRWKTQSDAGYRQPKRFKLQGYYGGEWIDLEISYGSQDYAVITLADTWTKWLFFTTDFNCEKYRMFITTTHTPTVGVSVREIEIAEYQAPPVPTVIPGLLTEFTDADLDILEVRSTGESDGAVTLASTHDTANVLHIYGLDVQDEALCVNRPLAEYVETFSLAEDATKKTLCGGMHYRVSIPASALTQSGNRVRLTLHAGHDTTYGAQIRHCAIAKHADIIKIPRTGHGFIAGDVVTISGATHYDGTYTLPTQTGGDEDNFIINGSFVDEVFGPEAKVTPVTVGRQLTGEAIYQAAPDWFKLQHGYAIGDTIQIVGTTRWNGIFTVTGPYGWISSGVGRGYEYFTNNPNAKVFKLGADQEKSLSGSSPEDLGSAGGMVAAATPTPLTFNGAAGVNIPVGETAVTDWADFDMDEADSCLVIIDCEWGGSGTTRTGTLQYNALSDATTYYYQSISIADNPNRDSYDVPDPYVGTVDTRRWRNNYVTATNSIIGVFSIEVKQQLTLPTGLYVATTTDAESLDISYITSFEGVAVDQSAPASTQMWHAVSLDSKQTFRVFLNEAWRMIVRYNSGTWQYHDGDDVWQDASPNTLLHALHKAFGFITNQMTAAQLEAITSEQWVADGGIVLHHTSNLDFAVGMQVDGIAWPSLTRWSITYTTEGVSVVEGWKNGEWSEGDSWSDATNEFANSGIMAYRGASPFEADYSTVSDVPGFWYRIKMKGTSPGTSITRLRYRGPCQPLANIGDSHPDTVMTFIYYNGTTKAVVDYSAIVSDWVDKSEFSKADIPLTADDYLSVGYLSRFFEIEVTPYINNNTQTSTLHAEYWNGEAWTSLAITDGTSVEGATLATQGKITWSVPDDWRMNVPLTDTWYPRGYYLRFTISANLSPTTAIAEIRVRGIPDVLKKHKEAVTVRDRIALINRPDAPDQVDVSRALEEYGFSGPDSGSYRVGGMDGIASAVAAWNGLLVGKTETWHQLLGASPGDFGFQSIEAARHVPVNSTCIVKAPADFGDGDRYGLFFLNAYGAFVASGLHVDSLWNSARGQLLSDSVKWWTSTDNPRLDLDHLHLARGVYWPASNWIIWSVPMITGSASEQTANNRLIVYDLTFRTWLPPFTISLASLTTAYHYSSHAPGKLGPVALYGGDHQGRILRLFDSEQTTDNDAIISAWIETGWLNFGSPEYRKILRLLTLYGGTAGDGVKLEAFTDGEESPAHTSLFRGLRNLGVRCFVADQLPHNLAGKFFKFRLSFDGVTDIYGLQIGTSVIREWGAM